MYTRVLVPRLKAWQQQQRRRHQQSDFQVHRVTLPFPRQRLQSWPPPAGRCWQQRDGWQMRAG